AAVPVLRRAILVVGLAVRRAGALLRAGIRVARRTEDGRSENEGGEEGLEHCQSPLCFAGERRDCLAAAGGHSPESRGSSVKQVTQLDFYGRRIGDFSADARRAAVACYFSAS